MAVVDLASLPNKTIGTLAGSDQILLNTGGAPADVTVDVLAEYVEGAMQPALDALGVAAAAGTTAAGVVAGDLAALESDLGSAAAGKGDALVVTAAAPGGLWTTIRGFIAALLGPGGASLVGYMPAGAGAAPLDVQSKLREAVSVLDFYANGVSGAKVDPTGVIDSTLGIQAAINFANGKSVFFPGGTYKVTDTLSLTVWKYHLVGERNERGCNAIGQTAAYATTKIVFTPVDTTKPLISRSDASGSFSGVIGPFEHENLTFSVGAANGFVFGNSAISPVADGSGEKYVFGVRFKGCALHADAAARASSGTGVITRSGRTLVSLTKAFESELIDTSLYGCDVQVKTFGCDKPVMRGVRSQGSHLPFSFEESGTFTVQHTLDDVQVEGWTFTPVQSLGVELAGSNCRFEQNDGNPIGSGINPLTANYGYTATVTSGSATVVFSSSMAGILFPHLSIIRLVSGANDEWCFVTAVSGVNVTVDTTCFAFNWSASGVTVFRQHGVGPLHLSSFDAAYSNVACGASLNSPAFVYVASRGSMHISGATAQAGSYGNINSLAIGNQYQQAGYLNSQMAFSGCTPMVIADMANPYVSSSNWFNAGTGPAQVGNERGKLTSGFPELMDTKRIWTFSPRRTSSAVNNVHKIPFKKYAGDANTSQSFYAWEVGAGVSLKLEDYTLPAISRGVLRATVRCKAVSASDSLALTAIGNGGTTVATITITNDYFKTYEILFSIPATWSTGVRSSPPSLDLTTAGGVLVQSCVLEDISDRQMLDYGSGSLLVNHRAGITVLPAVAGVGTATGIASVDLTGMPGGHSLAIKLKASTYQRAPNAAYSEHYGEWVVQVTYQGGVRQIFAVNPVASLATAASSVNAGISTLAPVVTASFSANVLTIYMAASSTGSQLVTSANALWDVESRGVAPLAWTAL